VEREQELRVLHKKGRSSLSIGGDDEGGGGGNEWIMSYADTVTLLLCFFIIFFAETNKAKDKDVLMEMSQNFNSKAEEDKARERAEMLSKIESEVRGELAQFEVEEVNLGIVRRRKEILLRLYERDFFHIGSYLLKTNGQNILEEVSQLLKPFQDKVLLKVEGHSDSLPVNPFSRYQTNLNLSSLRASEAANVLIANGLEEQKIRVVGYGSARKIAEDRLPASEGGAYLPKEGLKNRRIEIRIQTLEDKADEFVDLTL